MPKAGLYIGSLSTNSKVNAAYLGLGLLYGQKSHFLRFGIDAMAEKGFARNTVVGTEKQLYFVDYAIQPTIGYRFQKKKKGLFFSATLRPTFLSISTRKNEVDVKIRMYNFKLRELPYVVIPSPGIGYSF